MIFKNSNYEQSTCFFYNNAVTWVFVSVSCRCFGEDLCISIPDIKTVVMVMVPSKPQISITGTEHVTIPAAELQTPLGAALFKEIHIISTVIRSDGTFNSGNTAHNILLDSKC